MPIYFLTYFTCLLTYSITCLLTPWSNIFLKANCFSSSQEIPRILWNPKVHYPFTIAFYLSRSRAISVQSMPPSHFLKTNINIILLSMPGSSEWCLSLKFPNQNPVCTSLSPYTCYMCDLSNSSRFYHPNIICCGVQFIELLLSPLSC